MIKKINYVENNKELSINLQNARKNIPLTQAQICEKINIDRSTFGYYESGKLTPDIFILIKLSEIYNVSLEELITKS